HNMGHTIIALLEKSGKDVCVLTQNIDGFHRQAGSSNVIEIHGRVEELCCTQCGDRKTVVDYSELSLPPKCDHCDGGIRPNVVLFGEMLPTDAVDRLQRELS
ncbi:MAG: NAD-dependent protein deacylase, partial [Phototrophicales bacterium]